MASKILSIGAIAPVQITIGNKVSTAAVDAIRPDDASIVETDPYITDGPYGDQVTVQPVRLSGLTSWRMPPNGGVLLSGAGSALRCGVWVRLRESHISPMDVSIKLTTRNPLVSQSGKSLLMPGVWSRLKVDVTVAFTAATQYELELNATTAGTTPLVDVWMESWTIEDFSTPWDGHHRLNKAGSTSMTVADTNLPLFVVWGDSIVAGGGSSVSGHYLAETIAGLYECTLDASSKGGVGGETSAQVLTRVTAASAAIKQRASIIWCGINDGLSISPEQTVRNIISMIDLLVAQGNTRYAVCTVTHVIGVGPGTELHARRAKINRLLKAHPKLTGRIIDTSAALGDVPDARYMGDVTHPNNVGYQSVLFPVIKAHLDTRGWFRRRQAGDW